MTVHKGVFIPSEWTRQIWSQREAEATAKANEAYRTTLLEKRQFLAAYAEHDNARDEQHKRMAESELARLKRRHLNGQTWEEYDNEKPGYK